MPWKVNGKRLVWLASLAILVAVTSWPDRAKAQLLDEIVKKGKVVVGIDLTAPPFGLQDKEMKPAGYDVEVANLLAKDLGVQLEIVQDNSSNRIPYLMTKRVDVTISNLALSTDRAKTVAFSIPYCALSANLMMRKSVKAETKADLVGKKIGVPRGTFSEADALSLVPSQDVIRFDDEASAQAALVAGQVDGYIAASVMTKSLAERHPELQLEDKMTMRWNYHGIGIRRGDADMLRWLDVFVFIHRENGDLARLYEKWFGRKLPDLKVF
jgi:polar amino acid transport system substrate-binding protein